MDRAWLSESRRLVVHRHLLQLLPRPSRTSPKTSLNWVCVYLGIVSCTMQHVGRIMGNKVNKMACLIWIINKCSFLTSLSWCLRLQVPRNGVEGTHSLFTWKISQRAWKRQNNLLNWASCACALCLLHVLFIVRAFFKMQKSDFCKGYGMLSLTVDSWALAFPTCSFPEWFLLPTQISKDCIQGHSLQRGGNSVISPNLHWV